MIKEVDRAIAARDFAALTEMVELIEENLCVYFSVEEKIAQALNFDFSQHRLAHQDLLREFQRMKDEITVQNDAVPKSGEKSCIKNLMDCLILHVQEDSKPLKILLDTNFYDFKPN
ncbi:MAG: hypothetical protein PHP70_01800 [Gallionella sp.]|nr:hypothetical protein [Gallionella sp.]